MKKFISVMAILAIMVTSLFVLTGCGAKSRKKKIQDSLNELMDAYNTAYSDLENELANELSNTNSLVTNTTTNSSSVDKTPVDYKSADAYYVVINGKKYTTANQVKEIEGYTLESSSANYDLKKNMYLLIGGGMKNSKNNTAFSITPINLKDETVKGSEGTIGGFSIADYQKDYVNGTVTICNGITLGTSMDDVVAVFGEPTEKDMREEYSSLGIKYKYKADTYKYFEFEFDKTTKKVTNITWRYFNI